MSDERRYTRYAEKKAGKHNKFYEVEAIREEGATHCDIFFRWGRIGTTGQEKRSTSLAWSVAVNACEEQFEKKLKKGYKEVTAMQALASAVQDPTERRSEGGLPPVQIPYPTYNERLAKFFEKYLTKLNVIRDSRRTLGFGPYRDQITDLLVQYDDEWRRIRRTKAHSYLGSSETAIRAVKDFRHNLRANAGITFDTSNYFA